MINKLSHRGVASGLDGEGVPDGENPEWTAQDFANAGFGLDGLASFIGEKAVQPLRKGGRPKVVNPKQNGTLRLAADLWNAIKASGKGYNSRVEAVLREALDQGRI